MKKVLFFLLLIGVFFVGSLTTHALNTTLTASSIGYIYNNKSEDEAYPFLFFREPNDNESLVFGNVYLNDQIPVYTNSLNKYYVAPNKFHLGFSVNSGDFNCVSNAGTITLILQAYRLDPDTNKLDSQFNAYNFWDNAEFYITNDQYYKDSWHERKCTAVSDTSSMITVTCPYDSSNRNSYLHIHAYSEPFKEMESESEYLLTHYGISINKNVYYECLPHPFLDVSSTVSGDKATITVSNYEDDVVGFYYYLPEIDGLEVYSTSNTYVYENLSNGTYTVNVNALYSDGSKGSLSQTTFTITDSLLPSASFILSQISTTDENASIYVDASSSYGVDSSISTYYFKLDDGQWYSSTSPIYNFLNVGFGSHRVYVKVQDLNGNFSTVVNKYINVLTPTEQQKSFWDRVIDFFNNFFTNLQNMITGFFDYWQSQFNLWFMNFLNATARIFLPSQESMESWLSKMNDLINNQMGFLAYPFTWTLTFLERFVGLEDTGSYVISWPSIKVPNFDQNIIAAGSYDLATLLNDPTLKNAHDIYIMAVNAIILLLFMNTCWNKFNEVFGGSIVSYDTEIISDNATIDSKGNVHTSKTFSNRSITRRRRL